jgi:16S rRNA processing protein RimM
MSDDSAATSAESAERFVRIGDIGAPVGLKGFNRVISFTEPRDNIFKYQPWRITTPQGEVLTVTAELAASQQQVRLGAADRDAAARFVHCRIEVPRSVLPPPTMGEYYYFDLVGCRVVNLEQQDLGVVDHLFYNGANHVLVVTGERERMLPFAEPQFVKFVDLQERLIRVDWDADF